MLLRHCPRPRKISWRMQNFVCWSSPASPPITWPNGPVHPVCSTWIRGMNLEFPQEVGFKLRTYPNNSKTLLFSCQIVDLGFWEYNSHKWSLYQLLVFGTGMNWCCSVLVEMAQYRCSDELDLELFRCSLLAHIPRGSFVILRKLSQSSGNLQKIKDKVLIAGA